MKKIAPQNLGINLTTPYGDILDSNDGGASFEILVDRTCDVAIQSHVWG